MNPWGLVVLALGLILVIIAWHGSQSKVFAAIKGVA